MDERVLIISKWGHITDSMWTNYGLDIPASFRPAGLLPGTDVKWWMSIPTDGWNDIKEVQPKEGEVALTMGMYGRIHSGIWKRFLPTSELEFLPFVWPVLFWRSMPALPRNVRLSFQ